MKKNNGNLKRKGLTLKRSAIRTGRSGLSFVPGVGLGLSIHDTTKKAIKTTQAAIDYGDELIRETKRQLKKRNPFI